jgi:hypothetical protein
MLGISKFTKLFSAKKPQKIISYLLKNNCRTLEQSAQKINHKDIPEFISDDCGNIVAALYYI